ncbi:MAG TPA: O-antigen ligase [Caulobacteraceae bacterium]|nr:O-antigen ligase [Caulobacteraceae bacterium]
MTTVPPLTGARGPTGRRGRTSRAQPRKADAFDLMKLLARIDLDLCFGFAMFLPMVFILQLGMKGAAAFVLATVGYAALRWREVHKMVLPRLILFVPAGLACFSMIWSEMPTETLKQGLELAGTIFAAVLIASARRPDMALRGMALAFLIYVVVSLAAGGTVTVGSTGVAFSGLGKSKNLVADIAATGLIITLGAAWLAARSRNWLWALGLGAATVLEIMVVMQARSAGATLGLAVGLGVLFALAALSVLPKVMRVLLGAVLAMGIVSIGVFYRAISTALAEATIALFDKDPTLTGRTYLWDRAFDLIREKPLVGLGFQAFWHQGNAEAEGLWRYAGITSRQGFNFHNTFVELLVHLGWIGLVLIVAVLLISVFAFAVKFVRKPTPLLCVWGALLMYELVRMPIETIGFYPFYFSTVLMFGALAMGLEPREKKGPQLAPAIYRYTMAGRQQGSNVGENPAPAQR